MKITFPARSLLAATLGAAVVTSFLAPVPALAQAAAETTHVAVDNPYGFQALWQGGDLVARGVLVAMLVMSMGSWYFILTKLFEQHRVFASTREAGRGFWHAESLRAGAATLTGGSALRLIAETGLEASEHHEGTLVERIDLHTWVGMSIEQAADAVQSRLQDGLAFLATVGSTAPFVGLFGTVWGIYHALTNIGIAGQASIDKVAGPVGEALIMTAVGLAVAVPAVMGYNWLVRRNKLAMERVRAFAGALHKVLLAGGR